MTLYGNYWTLAEGEYSKIFSDEQDHNIVAL